MIRVIPSSLHQHKMHCPQVLPQFEATVRNFGQSVSNHGLLCNKTYMALKTIDLEMVGPLGKLTIFITSAL